jgi:hypothetical protein
MNRDMSALRNSPTRWLVLGWLATMASGALAASLLRLSIGIPVDGSLMILAHGVIAVAMGSAVIGHLVRARPATRLLAAVLVSATFVLGFFAVRSFAPTTVAAHATVAAYAALALAATATRGLRGDPATCAPDGRSWQAAVAGAGVMLLILQIALGALLRHHLIGYGWHLLVGGLAALSIFVPAVAASQDARATSALKHAARLAIGSLLVQLSLGVLLLVMIMTGWANVYAWLLSSVAHVVAGTITLLAAARLACVLRPRAVPETIRTER